MLKRLHAKAKESTSVVGQSAIWSPTRLSLRQYGLVLIGLLVLAGGIVLFAANSQAQVTFTPTIIPLSAPEIPNVSRGQYFWSGASAYPSGWPLSDVYYRSNTKWNQLEPSFNSFDFSSIDQGLKQAQTAGYKFGFRVMAYNPGFGNALPTWVPTEPNNCGDCNGGTYPMPDWNNASSVGFATAYGGLMNALANHITPVVNGVGGVRMADDPRLGWVDMGGYGDWGEWHLYQQTGAPITETNMKTMMSSVINAFPNKKVLSMGTNLQFLNDAVAMSPNVGIRWDCLGTQAPGDGFLLPNAGDQAKNRWQTAPFVTEWCNGGNGGNEFSLGLSQVQQYHISLLSSDNFPTPASDLASLEQADKTSGYRYQIDSATLPSELTPGSAFTLTSKWENVNVAPTYEPWTTQFQLRNAAGQVSWTGNSLLDLKQLLPTGGTPKQIDDQFTVPQSLPAGMYTLAARVVDPAGYLAPMNLAIQGRLSDGSYPLGQVTVGTGSGGGGGGDTAPPAVSVSSPAAGATVSGTATVSAAASDNVGVASVQFKLDGTALGSADTASPFNTAWDTAKVPNGPHTLTATATDTAGNTATSAGVSVTVSNQVADTSAPTPPTGLSAAAPDSAHVNLHWNAATDNVAVTGYKVYRNGSANALAALPASSLSYPDSTVSAGTTYTYTVTAIDAAGNESTKPTAVSVTTPQAADTAAPSVPTGLSSPSQTTTSVSLTWNPSTDNSGGSGLAGYHLYRGSTLIASPVGTTYTDAGLTPATAYTYSVSAYDKSANASVASSPLTVSTQSNPVGFSCNGISAFICEDFSTGAADFTTTGGVWTTSSGHYNLSGPATASDPNKLLYSRAINAKTVSGDFTLSFNGSTPSTNAFADFGAIFGYTDPNNYYYIDYNHTDDSGTNGIFKVSSGTQAKLADFPVTINSGTTYPTRIVRSGATITVYRGSAILATATDSTFTSGKVGLGSRNDPASFDSLLVTTPAADTVAPSAPAGLSAAAPSSSQVNLTWQPASDNVAVAGYRIYRSGTAAPVATVTSTSYGDAGLSAATTYAYSVTAVDGSGNESAHSDTASATTASAAPQTVTLSGKVTDAASSQPIAGASVATGKRGTPGGAGQATTNSSGLYVLSGITPGTHSYYYRASGHYSQGFRLTFSAGSFTKNVSLRPY